MEIFPPRFSVMWKRLYEQRTWIRIRTLHNSPRYEYTYNLPISTVSTHCTPQFPPLCIPTRQLIHECCGSVPPAFMWIGNPFIPHKCLAAQGETIAMMTNVLVVFESCLQLDNCKNYETNPHLIVIVWLPLCCHSHRCTTRI